MISKEAVTYANTKFSLLDIRALHSCNALLRSHRKDSIEEKLEGINRFVNGLKKKKKDSRADCSFAEEGNWLSSRDHWSNPIDTLCRQSGDCEDYAILKYYLFS